MSYLIFCSFEVGAFPFRMAMALNRNGVSCFYVSVHANAQGHNSDYFHYGDRVNVEWNLSDLFRDCLGDDREIIERLKLINEQRCIKGCLATGDKAHLLSRAGIVYTYWSFGSDLDHWSFCGVNLVQGAHRKSIRQADSVIISPYQYQAYRKVASKPLTFIPHLFLNEELEKKAMIYEKDEQQALKSKMLKPKSFFFSSTRHVWYGKNAFIADNKGNDVIIKSFARFLNEKPSLDIFLVLILKGEDVKYTKLLSEEMGIADRVVWLDELTRESLTTYYRSAKVVFGQFGTPVLTYAALESLAHGTPCITYFGQDIEKVPFYDENPIIVNALTVDQVVLALKKIFDDNDYYLSLSEKSHRWLENNCSENAFTSHFLRNVSTSKNMGNLISRLWGRISSYR